MAVPFGLDKVSQALSVSGSVVDPIVNGVSAGLNFKAQQDNLNYQKNLQKQIFEREDTAVQRRAKDLQAAGLSKTLAAGSSADSGAVVSTRPVENNFGNLGSAVTDGLTNVFNTVSSLLELEKKQEEITGLKEDNLTKNVNNLIFNQEAKKKLYEADLATKVLDNEIATLNKNWIERLNQAKYDNLSADTGLAKSEEALAQARKLLVQSQKSKEDSYKQLLDGKTIMQTLMNGVYAKTMKYKTSTEKAKAIGAYLDNFPKVVLKKFIDANGYDPKWYTGSIGNVIKAVGTAMQLFNPSTSWDDYIFSEDSK